MGDGNGQGVELPQLVAGVLQGLNRAFAQKNEETLRLYPYLRSGAIFAMDRQVLVEFKGVVASSESGGFSFFGGETEQEGAETFLRIPIRVLQPPEAFPFEMALGGLVTDAKLRKGITSAAVQALGFTGESAAEAAPVWRIGEGHRYMVLVPGTKPRVAVVRLSGQDWLGEAQACPQVLWDACLRPLAERLARQYEKVLGVPKE